MRPKLPEDEAVIEFLNNMTTIEFSKIAGITPKKVEELVCIMKQSYWEGWGIAETTRRLHKMSGIDRKLLKDIVWTETMNAGRYRHILEGLRIASGLGIAKPLFKWMWAFDGKGGCSHSARADKLYTLEQVGEKIMSKNCRCSITLHLDNYLNNLNKERKEK